MSITPSIYDFFGNLIPGLLYLYVLNEALIAFHLRAIDLRQLDQLPNLVLVGLAAYLCGVLADAINHRIWYSLFDRVKMDAAALASVKRHYKGSEIRFSPIDSRALFAVIRHHTPEIAKTLENNQAKKIMLSNVSLGAALFAALQIILAVREGSPLPYLIMAGLGILASVMGILRAQKALYWFNRDVFYEALNYGTSLEEVLAVSRKLIARPSEEAAPAVPEAVKQEKKAKRTANIP